MELSEFIKEEKKKQQKVYTPKINEILMTTKEYSARVGQTSAAIVRQLNEGMLDGVKHGKKWLVRVIDNSALEENEEIQKLRCENVELKMQLDMIKKVLSI